MNYRTLFIIVIAISIVFACVIIIYPLLTTELNIKLYRVSNILVDVFPETMFYNYRGHNKHIFTFEG